jgi:hypothetical protein
LDPDTSPKLLQRAEGSWCKITCSRCLNCILQAIFWAEATPPGRALVNPLLIFPYRVIKCVTIAKN